MNKNVNYCCSDCVRMRDGIERDDRGSFWCFTNPGERKEKDQACYHFLIPIEHDKTAITCPECGYGIRGIINENNS